MMTVKETMARPRGAMALAALRSLALAIAFAAVGIPVVSWAQQVPDAAAGAHRPGMDSAANGVPVVDIVAPNAKGVSHNKYQRFDVDQRGVILNNSASIVRTQLGGYIAGNDNLKGGEASLILNEVTSALPSNLRGYIEVGGKAAAVVIANPYGITCDGCGVINSQRFTLTTGTPVFGGTGSLDAFHVTGGSIAIGSGGLDGSVVDRTDLIARAVQVNGQLWAKDLNVVTGTNDANYADAGLRANAADGARPAVAIDVAALGGMYAEKIRLVGTEAGVGVVSSGAIAAQAGDLELTSAGEVRLGGTTVALNNATLNAAGPVTISGNFGTQSGNVALTSQGPLAVRGGLIAGGALAVNVAGDIDASGRLSAGNDMAVYASGTLANSGLVYSGQSFDLRTGSLRNTGTMVGIGDVALHISGAIDNASVAVSGGALDMRAASITNRAGAIVNAGTALAVTATGGVVNDGSLVGTSGLTLNAQGLINRGEVGTQQGNAALTTSGDMQLAGTTVAGGTLTLRTPGAVTQQGQLTANGIDADVGALDNQGDFYARGNGQVHVSRDLNNAGALYADGRLALSADGTVSNSGTLHAGTDLTLTAATLDSRKQIDAANDVALTARSIRLAGNVQGGRDVALAASGTLENSAAVVAGRDVAVNAGSLANSGALSATRRLALSVGGDVSGAGQLYAGQALTAEAGSFALANGGSVSAGDSATLRIRDGLTNAGSIVAANALSINAGSIDSTGSLGSTLGSATLATTGGDLHLGGVVSTATTFQAHSAQAFLLDGKLTGATLDVASANAMSLGGSFYASGNAVFEAGQGMLLGGDAYADGALTLHAVTSIAQSGTTHAGGDLSLQATSISTQGTLDAAHDVSLHADTLNLAGRMQAGHDLVLTATQDVANAGLLYAGNVLDLDAASVTQAAAGQVNAAGKLSLSVAGALSSDGALIGGTALDVYAGSLRSGGQLGTTAGDVTLTTTQGDLVLTGTTVASGRIDAASAGALAQTGSFSASSAGLTAAGDLTLGGDTSVNGALALQAGRDLHNTGSVYTTGTLDVHAARDLDNRGSIASEQALTADAQGALTQDASGKLQSNGNLAVTGGQIDSAGLLASAHDVTLASQGDVTLSGTAQAGGTLGLTAAGALTNGGKLLASSGLSVDAARIGNTGDISTDGTLALHAAGTLDNQGNIYTGNALTFGGSDFTQGSSATLTGADDITVDVSGTVTNGGKLVATKTLDVKAASLTSTGTLGTQQGDVHLLARQGDLVLGGTVASAANLDANASGALRQNGQLAATGLTLHAASDLVAQGDIAARTASLSSGANLNQAGTLSAESITLDGVAVHNDGRTLSSGDLSLRGSTIDVAGTLAAGLNDDGTLGTAGDLHVLADTTLAAQGSLLAGHALDVQGNSLDLSYGTQRAGSDALLLARTGNIDHTGGDLAVGGTLTAQAGGALMNRGVDGHDARLQANALLLSAVSIDNTRGKLLQTGNSALALHTAGVFDNTSGTIASNGNDLTLHGSRVVNQGGSVQLAGTGMLDVSADQDVDNRVGTIVGNGTTKVAASAALANDGGVINAQGATTIAAASLSNTANGAMSGASLGVTVTNAVNNAGGLLQATTGNVGLTAGSLANAGGTIQSVPGAVTLGVGGTLDNGSGTIAAGGLTTLNTARLINAGTVSGGQLNVQATDTVANTGRLQSLGALTLRATNGLNNNGGAIEANGATTVNAASISNVGGRIANAGTALTQVTSGGGIDNRGGTLGGQGDVSLSGTSISNMQGGTLVAAGNMTLGTGQLDNTSGKVYAGNTFSFVNAGASATNANGKITAGRQLNLTLASLNNSGGTVQAGIDGVAGVGNVALDVRSIAGQGSIIANNTLGMHLVGDYIQAAGSSIKANGGFSLAVDGQFINNGSIQAVSGLTISAANITNSAGALLNSANTQLNTGGTITNAGNIEGNTVGLHAGTVNNTGSIMGGNVTIQAGTVINGADFGQATGNPDYQSGTIAATNSVDIYTNYLLNRDAQIFSLGSINVAGAARNGQGLFDTRAGQIDNISGSIQAQGSILLAANQINNVRRVLNTTSHTLSAEESAASKPLPDSDYKHTVNKVQEFETYTEYHTIDETVVNAASAQSQIIAGGNISLYGSVTNNTSTIAANGFLAVNQQGAGGGTGMVFGNENVANQSLAAGRTIQAVAVTHHIGCGWEPDLCQNNDFDTYSYRPDTDPSHYIHDNYTALGAVMSGAQGVSIGGVNVSNGGVTADGRSVGNTRLDPNAQAIGLSSVNKGNAQGAAGLPIGAQVDPATGHAPQVLGGAGQPLAGVTLPTGGIYSVRGGDSVAVDGPAVGGQITAASAGSRSAVGDVDAGVLSASATGASARYASLFGNAYLAALLGHAPSSNYLIETNARFADYSQFISSDFLLDKLGLDPARTMMRLGDGFYEQQLVTNQVTQLTGRTYLADYSSGLEEYQALMNNATQVAQAMNLSVGVALTADQVSALTQDMVWMVQQTVDGHEVLVPVVYLAKGGLGLTAQGAVIAGGDVSINASGSLSNDGTIRGENSTLLTASDLLNSGRISSGGLTAISATGNITNLNGRIDGAGVSLVAGGDIRSENLGGLVGRGMDASSITATQGLQISAGNNLSLSGTKVTAGGDALLSAGHDLTLSGQGVSAGGSLALAAGNNLSLESSLTTTHPYAWSNSLTGTQAQGITLNAGKDLSLMAGNDLSLSATTLKAGGNASLQAGNDLTVGAVQSGTRWKTETTGSSIDAGGSLLVQAGHDLGVQASALASGGDMTVLAGHDLTLTATTNGSTSKVAHDVTTLDAGGNLTVVAGHDATLEGTQLKAGGTAALQAGNDLNLTTVTDSQTTTASWKEGKKKITQTTTDETVRGTTLEAGKGVQIVAGHDANLDSATVSTTGDLTVAAGHDLNLTTTDETHTVVTDTKKKKSGLLSSKTTTTHDEVSETYAIGSSLNGANVNLIAGNDLNATAAKVTSDGAIALSAAHDVNLLAGEDVYDESHSRTVTRSGMTRGQLPADWNYQKQTKANADVSEDHVAIGTTLSGDSVTISAKHDITTQAAQIAGTNDVTLAAGNNLNIGTALTTHAEGHEQKVSTSGFIQDGLHVTIGSQKTKGTLDVTQVDATGSLIGSTDGRVTLAAGQDVHISGSDVISHTGTSIVGQNVTIDAGLGTYDSRQTQSVHSGGINVGLTGGVVSAAQSTYDSAHRAGQADDNRLKALYAAEAAYTAYSAVKGAEGVGNSGSASEGQAASGISFRVGLGASTANSHTDTHDDTTAGSTIRSDGNVTIAATNGNLNVIGSQIAGKDVALAATGDLNLLSQQEAHSQKTSSANAAGEIGLSIGSQTGIYATASVGKGLAHGNGTTNANTSVNASDTLSIVSGNDTNILGAQAKGETVVATIGGDLNIASQQATNDYASQYWQAGGTYVYGYGSQVSLSAGKTTSNYKSVDQVSGIGAGDGGFDIYVGGNTDLKGGVIASSADASKNVLSTGTLSFSDIKNEADYKSVSGGVSYGSTSGFSGSMSLPQSKDSSSTTRAGIAEGTIEVRAQPGMDLTGLDRDPDIDAERLKPIFDEKKVAEKQELANAIGQFGMQAAGDIAGYMMSHATSDEDRAAWADGGAYRTALHGMVGAAAAAVGGGNALQGALGAAASEQATAAMADYLRGHQIDPDSSTGKALMQMASAVVGGAAGGEYGAATALAGEHFNRELHPDEVKRIDQLAAGDEAEKLRLTAAACAIVACYAEYPTDSDDYKSLKALSDYGSTLTGEISLLKGQTERTFISSVGFAGFIDDPLFEYTMSDRLGDATTQLNSTYQIGTRAGGALQGIAGAAGLAGSFAFGATTCETGVGCVVAMAGAGYSADQGMAGLNTLQYGVPTATLGGWALQKAGLSPTVAEALYGVLPLGPAAVESFVTNRMINAQAAANAAARETYLLGNAAPRPTAVGVLLDPRLPEPGAGVNYVPTTLPSSNTNIANSHLNGYVEELQLANEVAGLPNQQVLKYGDVIGAHGSDIISVNQATGEVYLWDNKFRSSPTMIDQSPTFTKGTTRVSALEEARNAVTASDLPFEIKQKALLNLQQGTFVTNTVGSGSAKNSVQIRYCGGNVCQ